MSILDWETNSVTLYGETHKLDRSIPADRSLALIANDYDMAVEAIETAAAKLAMAATQISELIATDPSVMMGKGYEQLAADIAKAEAKRAALAGPLRLAFTMATSAV